MKKLIFILIIATTAYLGGCTKMTGGGWMFDVDGDRVSFGFTAQAVEETDEECGVPGPACVAAKGRFNLIDHGDFSGERVHIRGQFTGTFNAESPFLCEETANTPCASQFEGTAVIDGDEYLLSVRVTDNGEGSDFVGDFVEIHAYPVGGGDSFDYVGSIEGGNLQVHLK